MMYVERKLRSFPWRLLPICRHAADQIAMLDRRNDAMQKSFMNSADRAYERRVALRQIVKCVTPGANGTVQKMGRIAQASLDATVQPVHFARAGSGTEGYTVVNGAGGGSPVGVDNTIVGGAE